MKNLIRLNAWTVDEKRRKMGELLRLEAELLDQVKTLDESLKREKVAAAADPTGAGLTYPAYHQYTMERRENLQNSIQQMAVVIQFAQDELAVAFQDLKKYEKVEESRQRRLAEEQERRDQAMLDEIALNQHRQKRAAQG